MGVALTRAQWQANGTSHMATTLAIILPLLFWALPTYVAWRMGTAVGYRSSWLWGFFTGWIGVFVVARQVRPVREQRAREARALEDAKLGRDAQAPKLRNVGLHK